MFNATYFTYDGIHSANFGLMIADFDDSSTTETLAFSPTLHTIKPTKSIRFFHAGVTYDEMPQHTFSILSELPLSEVTRREVLVWLTGRNSFKPLQIHQPDLQDYYYRCVFTDIQIIFVNGHCHGFRVTANFDSPYQYGAKSIKEINVSSSSQEITLYNSSDKLGYSYPTIEFTATSGGSLSIKNKTDNEKTQGNRALIYDNIKISETIYIDNEIRHITSSEGGHKLQNLTSKHWLRLLPESNTLEISGTARGALTIACPTYIMMGF